MPPKVAYTVAPRYNEPRYNEDPIITNNRLAENVSFALDQNSLALSQSP